MRAGDWFESTETEPAAKKRGLPFVTEATAFGSPMLAVQFCPVAGVTARLHEPRHTVRYRFSQRRLRVSGGPSEQCVLHFEP